MLSAGFKAVQIRYKRNFEPLSVQVRCSKIWPVRSHYFSFSIATWNTGDVDRKFLVMVLSHVKMVCIDIVLFSSRSISISISISYTVQEILRKQSHVDGCLSSAVSQKFRSSPSNAMLFAYRTQQQAASHSEIRPHIVKTCKSCCLLSFKNELFN